MRQFAPYIGKLEQLLCKSDWGRRPLPNGELQPHLNGGTADSLRKLVSRGQIRRYGAFFTSEEMGRVLVNAVSDGGAGLAVAAWDPTCGAGDLLLRWSERLPVFEGLTETLALWGQYLHGQDIRPEFVAVAKRRITLAAIGRGCSISGGREIDPDEWLPNIRVKNFFNGGCLSPSGATILMNPPFTMVSTPKACRHWASGKVSFAAVAFLQCLSHAAPNQQVSAILPDVLRSGSRYVGWRREVESYLSEVGIKSLGRFDSKTDVDVFLLNGKVSASVQAPVAWDNTGDDQCAKTLHSCCDIRVGPVVPHRHKPKGAVVDFLTSRCAVPWGELHSIKRKIRFDGTTFEGPFLIVRRTSSPSDAERVVATLVKKKGPVAVENHLIVVKPKDGKLRTCRRILESLRNQETQDWVNKRIRCRHLTVKAMSQLPISDFE
jgi:hypothetical protein